MTSFMSKKKKYKFQVEICLEELLEVSFVAAVLFAKLRLLDGGSFQDHSSSQEVRDHKVSWDAKFSFPCKMMANASTGVMEKCILRISIRKECKGGRSFTKLGFVDLNLAEYAGAGLIHKKALLEGYDARHRQDNSMLKFRIQLNMISGDILFKAPSPSLKHKQIPMDETANDQRSDEFSSGSLAGSINSGSSGFGSLPKKRTPLPADLVIGQTLAESSGLPAASTPFDAAPHEFALPIFHAESGEHAAFVQEPGHSRNSSNTSQMSKASGYSSISHSRQSSSGDSTAGHIRAALQHESLRRPVSKFHRTYTYPKHRLNIPTTILSESPGPPSLSNSDGFHTPQGEMSAPDPAPAINGYFDAFERRSDAVFSTPPRIYSSSKSVDLSVPRRFIQQQSNASSDLDEVFATPEASFNANVFDRNFNALQKSASSSVVERRNLPEPPAQNANQEARRKISYFDRNSKNSHALRPPVEGVLRSKSDFTIPKLSPVQPRSERTLTNMIAAFLTPRLPRKNIEAQSTPINPNIVPFPASLARDESRAASMGNLKFDDALLAVHGSDGTRNPSSGSIQTNSDTGSLDRAKAAYERRKKALNGADESGNVGVPGRVEITRVNPEDFVADLLKSTNLEQPDDSAETSGLQLFIAKDGTASLGNHEVKSQMSTGINSFKQVVMDDR
ncbi:protein FAM102A isoform X2 [Dendroctonus ponderosae]|uniref:protein FAM102A isoform X2 n=1 Tax=Dendroctonus ponderosae TaxID=77166 RepID=UPI00203630FD|nr:protein FAM102A isoform X2 [Dendroctonus ponderosae]